ncbi:MAG: cation diffusion facilitator family transporter [Nocardioides sp.]
MKPGLAHALTPHRHDHADSLDQELMASRTGIRAVKISLLALLATAAIQLGLVVVTGSVSLLADTVHNFSDAMTSLPLWLAFALSARAATTAYGYGYGRAEDLAGVLIVLMILASAVFVGWESFQRLWSPMEIQHAGVVAAAGVVGFVGNEGVARYRMRVGRTIGSAALVADGRHARADAWTSLAVVIAAVGAWIGWRWADPVVGLLIMLAILVITGQAARDIGRRLMDATTPELLATADRALRETTGIHDVRKLRLRWVGHAVYAEATLLLDRELSIGEAEGVVAEAEHRLSHAVPHYKHATLAVAPTAGEREPQQP